MRKLIYYVAVTLDGFIARTDGSFDVFLQEGEHMADLFREFPETIPGHFRAQLGIDGPNRHFDTVLMGRHTWEVGAREGIRSPYAHMQQILVSRSLKVSPDPALELVSGDPLSRVEELKAEEGLDIWLCGGSVLASALFPAIDELILKVNPVVIGAGIPLFAGEVEPSRIDITREHTYASGFRILHAALRR